MSSGLLGFGCNTEVSALHSSGDCHKENVSNMLALVKCLPCLQVKKTPKRNQKEKKKDLRPTRRYRGEKIFLFFMFFPPSRGKRLKSDQSETGTNNNLCLGNGHLSLGVKGRRKGTPLSVERRTVDGTKWQIRAPNHCTGSNHRQTVLFLGCIHLPFPFEWGQIAALNPPFKQFVFETNET